MQAAQGLTVTEAFYWDLNDATRAFSRRFAQRFNDRMPTANQAGVYSSVLAYLNAVKAAGSIDGETVVAQMRKQPIQDASVRHGNGPAGRAGGARHVYVQGEDCRASRKAAGMITTSSLRIPGNDAFRPLDQGGCKLVTQ